MKSIQIVLCILLVVSGQQLARALNWTVCDPQKSLAVVNSVQVNDCENTQDACPFIRGFNKSIEMDFTPKQDLSQVKVKVAGKLSAVPVPFLVNPDVACGNYGFDCPLKANQPYKFKLSLPIMRTYPKINVGVFLRLIDEKGDIITCIEMPARIQEPAKP